MARPPTKPTAKPPPMPVATTKEDVIRLRITAEEKQRFTAAAVASGRTLSNWIRWIANRESADGKG